MSATKDLMALDSTKSIVEFAPNEYQFCHSDLVTLQPPWGPSGISNAEGELIYALVRMTRPHFVLETGTNVGVSASYICLALKDNNLGTITTVEHSPYVADIAQRKLDAMGFTNFKIFVGGLDTYQEPEEINFLHLDTELATRYSELVRFYPRLTPGALVVIHDLPHLDTPEFGIIPTEIQNWIRDGDLRVMTFPTAHGMTVLQKRYEKDYVATLLRRESDRESHADFCMPEKADWTHVEKEYKKSLSHERAVEVADQGVS